MPPPSSEDRRRDGEYQFAKQQSHQTADEEKRQNGREVGAGRGDDRAIDLCGCRSGGIGVKIRLALVAHDVLQHDDGAVDKHADTHSQSPQGHDVESQIAQGHAREGHHQGDGDRRTDNQRAAQISEKQIDDYHRQKSAGERCAPGIIQGVADEQGFVLDFVDLDIVRYHALLAEPGEPCLYSVDYGHRVGGGLLLNG